MRVLILSRRGIASAWTGDSTQMRRTVELMRTKVATLTHVFVDNDGALFDESDQTFAESLVSLCRRHDVVHQLPRLNFRAHRCISEVLDGLPCVISTVYWHNPARIIIAWRNASSLRAKVLAAVGAARAGSKRLHDYRKGCDVILPNSWSEGANVRKHFRLSKKVEVMPIPNAVVPPNFDLDKLPRPTAVPQEEYLVVPAAFAIRKNQLGLIRAFKGTKIPIVFMGDPVANAKDYWVQCKREATDNFVFLPHCNNEEAGYWAVLRHARCACLPSDCETPGIALLEAALTGSRPVVTKYGGTQEYYGLSGEYFDPLNVRDMRAAVLRGWARGRLSDSEAQAFLRFTWQWAADATYEAYEKAIAVKRLIAESNYV